MGEYWNGIKLGTCESLYYVRREEIEKEILKNPSAINKSEGNLTQLQNYLNLDYRFMYRFPFADEDNQTINYSNSRDYNRKLIFKAPSDLGLHKDDICQIHIGSGWGGEPLKESICVNLPCCPYHNEAMKKGLRLCSPTFAEFTIIGERYTKENPQGYTLFSCLTCGSWFSLDADGIEDIKVYLLRDYSVEAERIKPLKEVTT